MEMSERCLLRLTRSHRPSTCPRSNLVPSISTVKTPSPRRYRLTGRTGGTPPDLPPGRVWSIPESIQSREKMTRHVRSTPTWCVPASDLHIVHARASQGDVSAPQTQPDAAPACPVATVSCVRSFDAPLGQPRCQDRTQQARVRSLPKAELVTALLLLFFFWVRNRFALASKLLTTKCRTSVHVC
jgi:hypothetical protein